MGSSVLLLLVLGRLRFVLFRSPLVLVGQRQELLSLQLVLLRGL